MAGIFGGATKTQSQQPTAAAGVTIQTSCYGKAVPVVVGTQKIGPNLIWCGAFASSGHSSGGGGGKGGGGSGGSTTYTYSESIAFALGEGPIQGVGSIWAANSSTATTAAALGYTVFDGTYDQTGWSYLDGFATISEIHTVPSSAPYQVTVDYTAAPFKDGGVKDGNGETFEAVTTDPTAGQYTVSAGVYTFNAADAGRTVTISYSAANQEPPNQALNYRGVAYIAAANYGLGDSAELPNHNVEVMGFFSDSVAGSEDADPSRVVPLILADANCGLAPAFPAEWIGDLTTYHDYCLAAGLLMSCAYTEAQPAAQTLSDIASFTNADVAWTGGTLNLIPRGGEVLTGNDATYTPPVFAFALTDEDWLPENAASTASGSSTNDAVILTAKRPQDAVNQVTLEFIDRTNGYITDTVMARDLAAIQACGLNADSTRTAHLFAEASVARVSAQLILQRAQNLNTWQGTVGEHCIGIDIGDVGTISNEAQGLDDWPVRVTEITEQSDGAFLMAFEDNVSQAGTAAGLTFARARGGAKDLNADPGDVNAPVIFEPPLSLTQNIGLELWVAVSGAGQYWGGAHLWASEDGETYRLMGTIDGPARTGVLTEAVGDAANALAVDLNRSGGTLASVSNADFRSLSSLCYVDGELIAYRDATLSGTGRYTLAPLARGCYGSTISSHPVGSSFVRLDDALFKYVFSAEDIGKTLSLKFTSFNIWGGAEQTIDAVEPVVIRVQGAALATELPDVASVSTAYVDGVLNITWPAATDPAGRSLDYVVRKGITFASGQTVASTAAPTCESRGDDTYWVAAHYQVGVGSQAVDLYSPHPLSIEVEGATLVKNVIVSRDEASLGWPRALDGAGIIAGALVATGDGNILTEPDFLGVRDLVEYGGVRAGASYTIPASHRVDIGRMAACKVSCSTAVRGENVNEDVLAVANFLSLTDILGSELGSKVAAIPQVRFFQDGAGWQAWQDWSSGDNPARTYDFRVLLTSSDAAVRPVLSAFSFLVDMPDRIDCWQLSVPEKGMSVLFADGVQGNPAADFIGGPNGAATPLFSCAVLGGGPGDAVVLTPIASGTTITGFSLQVFNGASAVARTVHVIAQGY